jgi:hypothetical protein
MDAHQPVTLKEGDRYPLGPPEIIVAADKTDWQSRLLNLPQIRCKGERSNTKATTSTRVDGNRPIVTGGLHKMHRSTR